MRGPVRSERGDSHAELPFRHTTGAGTTPHGLPPAGGTGDPLNRTRTAATSGICTLALLLAACSSTAETGAEATRSTTGAAEPTEAHWSYDGISGPAEWAQLDEQYRTCGTGLQQSPVDLPSSALAGGEALDLTGQPEQGDVVDNGHTVQLTGDEDTSEVTFEGRSYALAQMHVHT
ncbi:MAG: hypothetical protein F2825_05700, partial [Actinobacteria bacterium]|nr:hypothetical protein [Actinomycetota bacterium]